MSDLTFTIARFGFLALLWFFIFLIVRALRRDTVEASASAPQRRRDREPSPAAPQGRRRGATRLIITEGPLAGSMVPLTPTSITIGRDQNCTLVLNDSYASSHHARVFPKDGAWWLEDLNSTNGRRWPAVPSMAPSSCRSAYPFGSARPLWSCAHDNLTALCGT